MMCTWIRWQLQSALDRDAARPARCARHLETCAACSAYAARLETLHGQLMHGAPMAPVPVRSRERSATRWLLLGAPIAALATVMYVVFASRHPAPPHDVRAPGAMSQPRVPAPAMAELAPISPVGTTVAASALDVLDATPLRQEVYALIADGERGTRAVLGAGGVARFFDRTSKR